MNFRPYIVNLLPCVARICRREDEGIQETLLSSMMKICPALMVFATDTEVKVSELMTNTLDTCKHDMDKVVMTSYYFTVMKQSMFFTNAPVMVCL